MSYPFWRWDWRGKSRVEVTTKKEDFIHGSRIYEAASYIDTERNGIYIVDLQKTVKKLEEAYNFVKDVAASGKTVLFVGTKKQAQEAIKEEATRCSMFYVNSR